MNDRGERRKSDFAHAKRKQNIAKNYVLGEEHPWYDNLHQYSKNKIHCSCAICRAKSYVEKTIRDKRAEEKMRYEDL